MYDGDAVSESHELIQVFGDQEDGATSLALLEEQAMNGLDGAHIETTRRTAGYQQGGMCGKLAGQQQALLVTARKDADLGVEP